MLLVFSAILSIMLILLVPLSPILASSTSSENNNLQKTTTIATTISQEQSNNLTPYNNPTHGIKFQYPSDWKLVEHGDNDYHNLNIVAEFLQPNQNNYYNQNISASHNSLRISVENYSAFTETDNNNTVNQLQNIGNHRLGAIGISCPGFDLKSNKKAIEIWTVKDNKVYIIDYVAYEQVYDITVPIVQNMIASFEIT